MAMVHLITDARGMWDTEGETLVEAIFSGLYLNPTAPALVRSMESHAESRLRPGSRIRFSSVHNGKCFVVARFAGRDWRVNLASRWEEEDGLTHWTIESIFRSDD